MLKTTKAASPMRFIQKLVLNASIVLALSSSQQALAQTTTAPAAAPTSDTSSQGDPLVAYAAYNAAVQAGKFAEAAQYGAQAWQFAEAKWGGTNPNTAGLAYNAAWSAALVGTSAQRIDAARRAVELASIARDSYAVEEARFLLAYAEFFGTEAKDRPKVAAKLAQAALPVQDTWSDFLLVNALLNSANLGATANRGSATIEVSERALAAIQRLTPDDNVSKSLAYLARAQGRLLTGVDREEAVADLIQARVAYGSMRHDDDRNWGALAAWELASRSIIKTINNFQETTGSRIAPRSMRALDMTPAQQEIVFKPPPNSRSGPIADLNPVCVGVRRDRTVGQDISYPFGEANDYRVAGVIVKAELGPDGRVANASLLGAVPMGPFGDSSLAAVRTWKFNVPAGTSPECLRNQHIAVQFTIE